MTRMTFWRRWIRPKAAQGGRANPRELLKAATSPRLSIVALAMAAFTIVSAVLVGDAAETRWAARERHLMSLSLDQTRSAIGAQVGNLANGPQRSLGRTRHETLALMLTALTDSAGLVDRALELYLTEAGEPLAGINADGLLPVERFGPVSRDLQQARALQRRANPFADVSWVRSGDRIALVASSPLGGPARGPVAGQPPTIVAVYWLAPPAIEALRQKLFSPDLTLVVEADAPARQDALRLPLVSASGETVAHLEWGGGGAVAGYRAYILAIAALLALTAIGIAVISRRKRKEISDLVGQVETQAYDVAMRDPLTGLLNRASYKRKLESLVATRASDELIGVVYIDLDRFKQVNDGYGHLKGDELLCAVTERLRDLSPSGVTVARLGGDEFAMIVQEKRTPEAIMTIAQRACDCLGVPFQLGDVEALIGGSVGVSICPIDGHEHQELLRRADIAMYRAKAGGRSRTVRFDVSMDNDVQERRALETDLRHALDRGELWLAYQPFWASDGQTLVGVEALIRWNHPTRGLVSPAFFIPIAEEAGLIHELGEWAIRTAMVQARPWKGIALAVNVSPVQFRRAGLPGRVRELLAETGFEPERLEIEITEGVLMEDADAAVKFIRAFREMGAHVALDDFGTGYSSLSYLRRFPFDKLKVDQSFVRALGTGPGTSAIIHSVIALGRALGLTVHAEGVETLEHHIFLRAAGCHHLQGFYFARPAPAAEIERLLLEKAVRPVFKPMLSETPPPSARPDEVDPSVDLGAQLREKVAAMKAALGGDAAGVPTPPPVSEPDGSSRLREGA
jgi:diguanylate cyclase (GGDEF)-like protein